MKRVFGFGVVFMLYVLGFFLLLGSAWLKQNFEIESFEQILFHLRFPLLDTDSAIAWYFIKAVVLPSVSFAMLMSFAPSFVRFLRAHKEARLGLWLGFGASFVGFVLFVLVREPSFGDSSSVVLSFSKRVLLPSIAASFAMVYGLRAYRFLGSLGFRLSFGGVAQGVVACAVLIVGANVMNNKLHITSYIAKGTQEYGELYESHYAISSELARLDSSHPQNLIIILAESLESTFSNGGGGGIS